jgi:hypothetical protein
VQHLVGGAADGERIALENPVALLDRAGVAATQEADDGAHRQLTSR